MTLVDKYVGKSVLASIGFVTLLLAGLQIFMMFVKQLDDLGRADFGILQAATFIGLQLPYQIYLFFPMASLLGALIGLGILAAHSELITMRAAGVSIARITFAVIKAAIVLILFVTLVGETLVPKMAYYANDYKMSRLTKGQALRTSQGLWLRDHNQFISIGSVLPKHILKNVYQFQFDEKRRMSSARLIKTIRYEKDHWQAYHIAQTTFDPQGTTTTSEMDTMPWQVSVKPNILKLSGSEPEELTLHQLKRYIREKRRSKQSSLDYQLAYWQRLVQPFTTLVMILLAIPFIFGPLRTSTMGSKLLAGASVGFGFYIVNRFFGPVSLVYQLPVELAAVGPTVLFAFIGIYFMRRVR